MLIHPCILTVLPLRKLRVIVPAKLFFLLFLFFTVPALADPVMKDNYLEGGMGGAADNFSAGRHSWDAARVYVTDTYTIRSLLLKMRRVECEQSGENCTPGANRVRPYFNARIYKHDYVYDRPGELVGSVSSNVIDFNTEINSLTTSHSDRTAPFVEVWFDDLNAAVEPGLYWIVIHNVDWTNVYPNHLDHYVQIEATNIAPVGGGSIYGRALSYTTGNVENTAIWTEKYTGQLNFAFYDDDGISTAVYTVVPVVSGGNGSITPATPQSVQEGSQITFSVSPNSGYVASVGGTCGGTLVGGTYTTGPVYADCTVIASFSPATITHTVTPSSSGNGSIFPATPQTVNEGDRIKFTVTLDKRYTASVGGTCGGKLTGNTYTTNPVYSDCTVTAGFTIKGNRK